MEDFELELRSGIEWMIRYEGNDQVEGYIADTTRNGRVAEVIRSGEGFFFGRVDGETIAGPERWFDDAADKVYGELQYRGDLQDRFVWHDLVGEEGIYKLGELDGKVYVANAFWSDTEPGYANVGVFEVDLGAESLEILTSGFYNGYLTIEKCVEQESLEVVPLDSVELRHLCSCNWEFDTFEEFVDALDEHDLTLDALDDEPRDEVADLKQNVMDLANERTNGAFAEYMTYEKAVQCLDEPGLGLPVFIEDMVARIEKLEETRSFKVESKDLQMQIDEARSTSEAIADRDHAQKRTQGMEDPSQ